MRWRYSARSVGWSRNRKRCGARPIGRPSPNRSPSALGGGPAVGPLDRLEARERDPEIVDVDEARIDEIFAAPADENIRPAPSVEIVVARAADDDVVLEGADVGHGAVHGRAGHETGAQKTLRQFLVLLPRLDHQRPALFAEDVNPPVRIQRRL